jgi:hypothetical protein
MIEKARHDYPKQKWIVDNADNIDNWKSITINPICTKKKVCSSLTLPFCGDSQKYPNSKDIRKA